jgi:hypothetical protein
MRMNRAGIPEINTQVVPTEGEWQHWAFTCDGNTAVVYLDGSQAGQGDFTLGTDPNAMIVFGCCETNGGNPFNGALDEIRIYSRVLSQGDVGYLAGKGSTYTQELYLLLTPPNPDINLYDDGAIDFKDYDALADVWGDGQVWPDW